MKVFLFIFPKFKQKTFPLLKFELFKKATKIDKIFIDDLTLKIIKSNWRWRFSQFLWPSQKTWTLNTILTTDWIYSLSFLYLSTISMVAILKNTHEITVKTNFSIESTLKGRDFVGLRFSYLYVFITGSSEQTNIWNIFGRWAVKDQILKIYF